MKNIYLLTLTWNACDKLTKLKDSILPALEETKYNWNWFIKDNGSNDKTVETASTWGDKVKVCPYKNNIQNFSEGMNYLFDIASPKDNDLVILLNNDVVFNDKYSIKNMINIMEKDDGVGVVGAKLLYTDTDKLQHAGVVFHNTIQTPTHFRLNEKTDQNAEKNREFQAVTGAVLLTKAEYYKNVCTDNKSGIKGISEKLIWAFDIDLCLAIKYNMQKKIVYCGKTNIFHEESASLKKNPANKLFMSYNVNYFKNKWAKRYILDQDIYTKNPQHNLYNFTSKSK